MTWQCNPWRTANLSVIAISFGLYCIITLPSYAKKKIIVLFRATWSSKGVDANKKLFIHPPMNIFHDPLKEKSVVEKFFDTGTQRNVDFPPKYGRRDAPPFCETICHAFNGVRNVFTTMLQSQCRILTYLYVRSWFGNE